MRGDRRATRPRGDATPLRFAIMGGVLLVFVLGALRLVPGSPFAAAAAAHWGEPGDAASSPENPIPSPAWTPTAMTTPTRPAPPPLPIRPTTVKINATGWWSWAMMDTRTGKISGSSNMAETSTTASLIKAWIGADFLRRAVERGEEPSDERLDQLSTMIRDSDNEAAQGLWEVVGESESIKRLISICKLTDSSAYRDLWSNTRLSPRDITRLGACLADGRAAGPKWTDWLLKEMRAVRGIGDFGIRKAFPTATQRTIAIKNGWVDRQATQEYHVSCLAIGDGWTMGVMARYPINLGYPYGARICEDVARQLRAT
jgi:Beta-lactamase enzyme family